MTEMDFIQSMSDDDLLGEINCHDPYDVEFTRRYRALLARVEKAEAACTEWAEVSQRNYQRAKRAEADCAELQDKVRDEQSRRSEAVAAAEARGREQGLREAHDRLVIVPAASIEQEQMAQRCQHAILALIDTPDT